MTQVIQNRTTKEINTAILQMRQHLTKIESMIDFINDKNNVNSEKLNKANELLESINLYDYVITQLLNLSKAWCIDHGSPVYMAVMANKMNSCQHCNSGQTNVNVCAINFYKYAQDGDGGRYDYSTCSTCQSIFDGEQPI